MARNYDVLVWGATGFTGSLVVQYLVQKEGLQFAIGGRNKDKLDKVIQEAEREVGSGFKSRPDVLVAQIDDPEGLRAQVGKAKVVIAAAGPFLKVGTPVVEACIAMGTDYVDITGEIAWSYKMMSKYGQEAVNNNVIICSFCGFDSIPSDLGTYYGIQKLREKFGPTTVVGKVTNYGTLRGGFSGGTLASGILWEEDPESSKLINDPFLLGGRPTAGIRDVDKDYASYEFDDNIQSWIAPFGMAGINTRIVRRSNLLNGYGGDLFAYQEVAIAPSEKHAQKMAKPGPPASKRAEMVKAGKLPAPGQGPTKEMRASSFFRMYVQVKDAKDPANDVWVKISSDFDPGYDGTALMVAESALCLAHDRKVLPKSKGFLTPSAAMGSRLIERLHANGIFFQPIEKPSNQSKL